MLRKRQVHLDFHTSEFVPVGNNFSKEQFQAALKAGHVNSITVFSKCHHGWSYHPTEVNKIHPELKFDLLGAQLEACKEINVNAPVYISAGYDEKEFINRPEWRWNPSADEKENEEYNNEVHFHALCFNTGYLEFLCAQIEEVMVKYNPCGIFLDIIAPRVCYCEKCRADMKALGLDIESDADKKAFAQKVFDNYLSATNAAVRKYSDTATVFHNRGHVFPGDKRYIYSNSHLELESLPTGGWGYDHFPLTASYARSLGDMEFLGMTGKFHHSWGEFGGYKHPNALIYETALSVASGAGCSIGDQMHSLADMNMGTYNLIGKAYALIEEREPWLNGAINYADIAVMCVESTTGKRDEISDVGANRMLLENHFLYNFVDSKTDLSAYKLLVLPDDTFISDELLAKINAFIANGGKVIATGDSIVKDGKFILDFGAEYIGKSELNPTYFVPEFETVIGKPEYVMRCDFNKFEAKKGEVVATMQEPYFNRTLEHFCSHMHAPNNPDKSFCGAVISGNVAYIGWDIFTGYGMLGHLCFKELFTHIIKKMMGDDITVMATVPDKAVVTYTNQAEENRNILHLLYAHTTVRGRNTEVIEDTVPLYNVKCAIKGEKCKKVTLVPEGKELDFEYADGRINFTVPEVNIHQMVEIAY